MNHKWNDDVCTHCGVVRKKHTFRHHMAILNHPPWDVYSYERIYVFLSKGSANWKVTRPDCVRKNNDRVHKHTEQSEV